MKFFEKNKENMKNFRKIFEINIKFRYNKKILKIPKVGVGARPGRGGVGAMPILPPLWLRLCAVSSYNLNLDMVKPLHFSACPTRVLFFRPGLACKKIFYFRPV